MNKNKSNLKSIATIAICFAVTTMISSCNKEAFSDKDQKSENKEKVVSPDSIFFIKNPSIGNFQMKQIYVVNNEKDLQQHLSFQTETSTFSVENWKTQSVLITYGGSSSGIANIQSSFIESQNSYRWEITVWNSGATEAPSYLVAKIVPKISSNAKITLNTFFGNK